jgi:hypothetical protein
MHYYCIQGTICFELMKGIPAAIVATFAAGIAGIIAWRQYKVAKAKLNLDLFERRYKIFHNTWEELSNIAPARRQVLSVHQFQQSFHS